MLKDTILADLKKAMKARDMNVVSVLRFLLSEVKNEELDADGDGALDDGAIQKIIAKQIKQMRDAFTQFTEAGREDLAQEETKKISVLEQFMPKQLTEEELRYMVKSVGDSLGETNMGALIKAVMEKAKGSAEGKKVSQFVREYLG